MAPLKVAVFMGSVRPGRMCDRVKNFVSSALEKNGFVVDVIDPMVANLPLLDFPFHFYRDPSQIPENLKDLNTRIKSADAYVVISAEYNHSVPPALSNLLGYFPPSTYAYKPSAIVCYSMGPYAGVRAAMQLRAMLGELQTPSVPTLFAVPTAHVSLDADGKATTEDGKLAGVAQKMIDELKWYAEAFKAQREKTGK